MRIWSKEPTALLEREDGDAPAPLLADAPTERDRLLLLIPEGSLAFRLRTFPDVVSAEDYVYKGGDAMPIAHWGAFWTHDSKPLDPTGRPLPAEVVTILRDSTRPGIVELSSFVDMEAAVVYLRTASAHGLDLATVLLYWVTPVVLREPPSAPKPSHASGVRVVAPVATAAERQPAAPQMADDLGAIVSLPATEVTAADSPRAPERAQRTPSLVARRLSAFVGWPGWQGLPEIIVRAALLKHETLEDVRDDKYATGRATFVVIAGALSAGVGAAVADGAAAGAERVMAAAIGWLACALTIQVIARRLFAGSSRYASSGLQAIGLASGPALLLILGAIPVYGPLFVLASFAWLFVSLSVAVHVSLELDIDSAILTAASGWLLYFAIAAVAPAMLG